MRLFRTSCAESVKVRLPDALLTNSDAHVLEDTGAACSLLKLKKPLFSEVKLALQQKKAGGCRPADRGRPMMEEISMHILDIAENSIKAGANKVEIELEEDVENDKLTLRVKDNANGMPQQMTKLVFDPYVTSRTDRQIGLGLSLLHQSAKMCDGNVRVVSSHGKGTEVVAEFRLTHPDRQPIGDIGSSIAAIVGTGKARVIFRFESSKGCFVLDSESLKKLFGDGCFSDPYVLQFVMEEVNEKVRGLLETW